MSGAARTLGVSRATLRRRLEVLESTLQVPLYTRAGDTIELTQSGALLVEHGQALLDQLGRVIQEAQVAGGIGRPQLRFLLQVGMPPNAVAAGFMMLFQQMPELRIDIRLSEDPLNEAAYDPDIISYVGPLPADGGYIVRAISRVREQLLATPAYLQQHGAPQTLEALHGHRLLTWKPLGEAPDRWPHRDGILAVEPTLSSTDIHFVRQLALSGSGIARLLSSDTIPDFGWGDAALVPVLPERFNREFALRLVLPARERSQRTRHLTALVEQMMTIIESVQPQP